MFPFKQQLIQVWGVVNATPDSFSDGGEVSATGGLEARLINWNCDGIDVGAESTNPRALPITTEEECQRLQDTLIPLLNAWPAGLTLSVDTYRLETMQWLLPQIPQHISMVWNDVSGKGEEALAFLKAYPKLQYVLCHNPAPERALAARHMDYALTGELRSTLRSFFRQHAELFIRHGVFERCWADPCFGFGKTREQNHLLLTLLPELMEELSWPRWVWGISRKSFMRFPASLDPKNPSVRAELDGLQLLWMARSLEKLNSPHTIVLRVHEPAAVAALKSWPTLEESWKS